MASLTAGRASSLLSRPAVRTSPCIPSVKKTQGAVTHTAVARTVAVQRNVVAYISVSGPGSAPGSSGAPAGQISAALMASMTAKISEALGSDKVSVVDQSGDGQHVLIDVVSKEFEGKNSMQRQRMVYKAIWFELQGAVHAVDGMTTKTPEEAGL
jgi:stress-induced morphogen